MTTPTLDGQIPKEQTDQEQHGKDIVPRRLRMTHLFRNIAIGGLMLLFTAAIFSGLGFWISGLSFLANLSLAFALTAGILSIGLAAFALDS
jgi:hypothetical protein